MKNLRPRPAQLGILAFLALSCGVVYASWYVQRQGRDAHRTELELVTEQAALRLEEFIETRLEPIRLLEFSLASAPDRDQATFESSAHNLTRDVVGLQEVNWVDRDGVIRWALPMEAGEAAHGLSVLENPVAATALRAALDGRTPGMTSPMTLFQGGQGVSVYFPIMPPGEGIVGYVNGVFSLDPLIQSVFGENTLRDFEVWIRDGEQTVFRDGLDLALMQDLRDLSRHEIQIANRTWVVDFRPRGATFGGPFGTFEPTLLTFGLVLAALLSLGLTFVLRSQLARQHELELRSELEARLLQAQKMEAIGRLAGGVAHDFNNLLTAIIGNADLIDSLGNIDERTRASLSQIRIAGERATQLTSQLLTISRRQVVQPRPIDLNQELRTLEGVLQRLIRENIHFSESLATTTCVVELDPGQLSQVIMNLVVNAVDAMPDGGALVVRTERIEGDLDGQPGDWVVLSIEDTGVGMNESTQRRALEPFFTTKEKGKGTGLGLATVDGIATGAGGAVRIESNQPTGTRVQVWLPASAKRPELIEPVPETQLGGGGVALIVEDDPSVLRIGAGILADQGYGIVEAHDGEQALALVDAGLEFDLLFTDAVMPNLGGRELLEALRHRGHEGLAVITSGYPDELDSQDLDRLDAAFLVKPYSAATLRDAVNVAAEQRTQTPLPADAPARAPR